MPYRLFIPFFLLFISFSSCNVADWSEDLDQEEIWGKFELFVDAGENESMASAYFRKDGPEGNIVHLSYPSFVSFNGDSLFRPPRMAYDYRTEMQGEVLDGEFVWTDYYGAERTYFVEAVPLKIPAGVQHLRYGNTYKITWEGDPLGEGEEIRLTLARVDVVMRPEDPEPGEHCPSQTGTVPETIMLEKKSITITEPGATSILIQPEDLSKISVWEDGDRYIYLDRIKKFNINYKRGQNGEVYSTYRDAKQITLTQ